ncbi:MAG: hypothetical protein WD971_08930 [Pirellulales bacterium]
MARSPAHRFGQIVGEVLEVAIRPLLERFAQQHGLYLDMKGERPCRRGRKCSWIDLNNNSHDLDFVLERGGTPDKIGMPVAFIETAWRRYTKHSRNKAQEIQGALEPLAETYRHLAPFKGAVLAGVFTDGAIAQLRSLGFTVLYFPCESVVKAFRKFGIDASSDESTSDRKFQRRVTAFEQLSEQEKKRLAGELAKAHSADVRGFLESLATAVLRQIERIIVLALHGEIHEVTTVDDAISFISSYPIQSTSKPLHRFEVEVRYNNGNVIAGRFGDQESAIGFLRGFQPVSQ